MARSVLRLRKPARKVEARGEQGQRRRPTRPVRDRPATPQRCEERQPKLQKLQYRVTASRLVKTDPREKGGRKPKNSRTHYSILYVHTTFFTAISTWPIDPMLVTYTDVNLLHSGTKPQKLQCNGL